MAKGQDDSITILLGLEDYTMGQVWEGKNKVTVRTEIKGRQRCTHCGSANLYSPGECKPRLYGS